MICSFPDCHRESRAKGLCKSHRQQQQRTGELRPLAEKAIQEARNTKLMTPEEVTRAWRMRLTQGRDS